MTSILSCYLLLEQLPDEVKKANKIKVGASVPRFDVTAVAGYYEPLEKFLNPKGMLFFYLQKSKGIINSPDVRRADYFLQCSKDSVNFSSIYEIGYTSTGDFVAFGEPNNTLKLKKGIDNPFYQFKNDGYLFVIAPDYQKIECLVLPDCRYTIRGNAQQLINGNLDEALKTIRQSARPVFNYWNQI